MLNYLKTYESPTEKYRLGKERDGGYVIAKQPHDAYDAYISAGVSDEESFSRDFIKEYGLTKDQCFAFDGTIADYPYEYTTDITFIKKNIGPDNTDGTTNLADILCCGKYKNILLKMDTLNSFTSGDGAGTPTTGKKEQTSDFLNYCGIHARGVSPARNYSNN